MKKVRYIESDEFLVNIFLELLKKENYNIKIEDIIKLEYYYLEVLDDDSNNIIYNSIKQILDFIKHYECYISISKEGEFDSSISICIEKPEDLQKMLIEDYDIDDKGKKEYKRAVKKYILEKNNKKIA